MTPLVRRLAAAFPSIAFLVGCKTGPSTPAPPSATATASAAPEPRSAPVASIAPASSVGAEDRAADADGERRFVARLYAALAKKEKATENLFVSPSSARFALGMVLGGARGDTERELRELLGATPRMHDVAASLATEWAALAVPPGTNEWEKTDTVTLRTANRLFGQKDRAFLPGFVELTSQRYGAPIEAVDFKADAAAAARTINDWVAEQTEGRITNIVSPPPPPETKLALANALYFKAAWRDPFRREATKPEPFFAASGAIPVPTMHLQTTRKYGETTEAHIVELPYGGFRHGDIAMVLVVPKKVDGLAELERSLDPDHLARWLRAPSGSQLVDLALPRFHIESTMSLGDTLSELGAPSLFRYGKADLSGIDGTKELFLGLVVHKTFVDVDEKGTEAAAATVAVAVAGAAPQAPPKPIVVRADRPFLFLIRDVVRNRTLFIGRLVQPKA